MKKFKVTVNGNTYEVDVEEITGQQPQIVTQPIPTIDQQQSQEVIESKQSTIQGTSKVVAPMPGKITGIKVQIGQVIKEGDLVAILEAMKMENEIFATTSGKVVSINSIEGSMVEAQDTIITTA